MTPDQIDRLKILSDARQMFSFIERELRRNKCPPEMGDWWGATFSVEGICESGASNNGGHVSVDIVTARLIWPAIRTWIDAEYHSLLKEMRRANAPARERRRGRRR